MNTKYMDKRINPLALIAVFLMAMISAGCEVMPAKQGTTIDRIGEAISEGVDETPKEQGPPPEVQAALLPAVNIEVPPAGDTQNGLEQRFDVATNDVPVQQFFMSLAEGTPYSIVVNEKVDGTITLNLKNVTVAETMEVVRDVFGYDYRQNKHGFMVFPRELQSRIFSVNYLNVKRSGKSEIRVTSGQLTQSGTTNTSGSASSDSGSSSNTTSAVTGSTISTTSETDFWEDLATALKAMIGEEEGRKVVVNAASGLVVVKAMPNELRNVSEFLTQIQNIVGRQVILEAKILEVELNDGYQAGINWAALGDPEDGGSLIAGQVGGGTIFAGGVSGIQGNQGVLDPRSFAAVDSTNIEAFGGMFTLALNLNEFNVFLELLQNQGNVQVLSSPRVSTVNNQKAVIKVGSDEYFVTEIENTVTTTAATESQNPSVKLTPFFSGIALDVTPQIDDAGSVTLHIHPSVSQVVDQSKTVSIGDSVITLPLAFSSTRESDSIIRAHHGQIVVIGGLMKDEMRENVASVPILGKLPFVGSLFRHTRQVSSKSELVILLRPLIVEDTRQWADARAESAERFKLLNRGFHYGGNVDVFGSLGEGR